MSTAISQTVSTIPDRTVRIFVEKPYGGTPSLMTVDESVTILPDDQEVHSVKGNMTVQFNAENTKHVALFTALEAVVLEMRAVRDAVTDISEPSP